MTGWTSGRFQGDTHTRQYPVSIVAGTEQYGRDQVIHDVIVLRSADVAVLSDVVVLAEVVVLADVVVLRSPDVMEVPFTATGFL